MAFATLFAGVGTSLEAQVDGMDIFLALLDDCMSGLSIVAVVFLINIAGRRYYSSSSPVPAKATKTASSQKRCASVNQKLVEGASSQTNLRVFAAAVRSGRAAELPGLLDQAAARRDANAGGDQDGAKQTLSDLVACLRMCVTASCFKEGLAAFDHVASRLHTTSGDLWSVLLYCATEVGEFSRCSAFMEKVWEQGVPSSKDLVNMSRCFAQQKDVHGMIQQLERFREAGLEVDILTRNRILAACTACQEVDMAEAVVRKTQETPMDIIGYHALIKVHSQAGNLQRCLELYQELRNKVEPTSITFGLVFDACVEAGSVDGARMIFADLQLSPRLINVVHYTTFIRSLTTAGEFDEATRIFENMLAMPGVTPDVGSWYGLTKALAENGHVGKALHVIEKVHELRFELSQSTFNVVLNGCAVAKLQAAETFEVFERLLKLGMQPSTPILSVMVKALSCSKAWGQAEALLRSAQSRFGFVPDDRLFAQLVRARRTSSARQKSHC